MANGTYAFTLTLDRLSATSVAVSYSFTETDGTGTFATSGSATDTGSENSDYSASATQIDAVGFFGNGNTGNMSFSNVEITQVPEPGTIALGVMGASALLFRRRK